MTDRKKLCGWVLYDAQCRICAALAGRFARALARRGFHLLPLQTPWFQTRLGLTHEQLLAEMCLLLPDGRLFGGADALLEISRWFWWAWPLHILGRIEPVKAMLRAGYSWVARHRSCANDACKIGSDHKGATEHRRVWIVGSVPFLVLPVVALRGADRLPAWVLWRWDGKISRAPFSAVGKRKQAEMKRIVVAGGSGFLGRALAKNFTNHEFEVVMLTRSADPLAKDVREVQWDGQTRADWTRELEGACAVINLAGRSVNCRYQARNRRLILDSRVNSTHVLGEAIARCEMPPRVWLNSSTATIYKHTFGPAWDEFGEIGGTPEAKDEFSVEVACAWEQAFNAAKTPATRKVALRSAMVLGAGKNSVFPVLRQLVRWGMGGKMASGKQFVSWIHEADFCRAVEWLIVREELSGPVNVASPNPIPNRELMRTLREVCGVPFGLPAARWMLELGAFFLRTETELIIKSRRVMPGRLTTSGFEFRFPQVREALMDLCARARTEPKSGG